MRVNETIGELPSGGDLLHRCWLAYLSDDLPTDSVRAALLEHEQRTGVRVAGDGPDAGEPAWWDQVFAASLDHAVWFHRPVRADDFHLYDVSCHGYTGGRGLATGHVFAPDGTHVATIAQEVLLRRSR